MAEALTVLTSIAIVLLLGLIATVISNRLRLSNVLLLLIIGILLKPLTTGADPVFEFSNTFLLSTSVLALVMITFDGTARLTVGDVLKFTSTSARTVVWFLIANLLILSFTTTYLFYPAFTVETIVFGLIFAIIMAGTDPGAVFYMMKDKMTKVIGVLELESIINTPVIVILPFILLDFLTGGNSAVVESFVDQVVPFMRQVVVGVGAGVVVGIVIFKFMRNVYHHDLSPLGIITAALVAYITAENLGGSGVLGVATMGLIFGNIYVKRKIFLLEFNSIFSNALEILVFVLVGFLIPMNLSIDFTLKSIALFILLIISRWFAITTSLKNMEFNFKEKLFMTLNMPKGIAVATVIFSLTIRNVTGLDVIIDLILLFTFYSLIMSTIIGRFSKKLIRVDVQEDQG